MKIRRVALAFLLAPMACLAAPHMMVVAANPIAAEAGLGVLRQGGTAVDAAVAVQAVLGLVEPQASGVGGGAFMLTYDAASRKIVAYDGRETAPASAGPGLFLRPDGTPKSFYEAAMGGRSVGVPGAIAMLELAQHSGGHAHWADLFQPAIRLAENGFPLTERVAKMIAFEAPRLGRQPALQAYLMPNGLPASGTTLKNPAYAATLREIAAHGASGLLSGKVAADIIDVVRRDENPGLLTAGDLAAYRPLVRTPVCAPYLGYTICSAPPPSAGGIVVLQTLGMLAQFPLPTLAPTGPDAAMLILEAERLAIADRDAFGADADFVPVPVKGLLDQSYIAARAKLIDPARAMATVTAGKPEGSAQAPGRQLPEHGTSDVAIVDAAGNAVSLTTTIEYEFGAHLLVDGFLLNNELTDFSLAPTEGGKPVANRVQGGKRPRSSMAPSLVLDRQGKLVAVVGSAGGGRIPGYIIQATIGALDWHMTPSQALAQGHVGGSATRTELEAGTDAATLLPVLQARGSPVTVAPMGSGSSMIMVTPNGLLGAADPRRDGAAVGE
ncbi:MAG: gamma-glutamyltransferase [Rhodospirillales bacterium]